MVDVFRISVVLAIVYFGRFILAHERQTEEDQFHSEDFQRGRSSSAIEDSNENIPIQSEESFRGKTTHQRVWSEEDVESNEKVLIQSDDPFSGSRAGWFEEEKFVELNEDNISDENEPIQYENPLLKRTDWSKEDKYVKSNEYNPSNENMLIKSGVPFHRRTMHHTVWSEEEKDVELKQNNNLNEKVLIQSGAPLHERTIHHIACSEEDKTVESNQDNPSNEKVLIQSGVPLRGRTIHHTAWSEEDKTVESNQDNPSNEKVLIKSGVPLRGRTIHHTAWSKEEKIGESKEDAIQEHVKKGIYDSLSLTKAFNYILSFIYDVEDDGAIVQTTVEDTQQILKAQNEDFPGMVLPQSQNILDRQKKLHGNLSTYNQDEDNSRGTTTSSLSASFQNQDTERFESGGGDIDNDDVYFDFEFDETQFEDKDYDHEDDFPNQFEDGDRVGALQRNPRKNIDSNPIKVTGKYFQENGENKNLLLKIKETENVQPTQEPKGKEMKVQETRNVAEVASKPSFEKHGAEEHIPKESSNLKLIENDPEINKETTEPIGELGSYQNYGTPVNPDETELLQDKQKKSPFRTTSNNIKNKIKAIANSDVESSIKTLTTQRPQPSVPSIETTDQKYSQIRKENKFIKIKTHDPTTQKHFHSASSTSIPKNLSQNKEQSFNFNNQVKNNKIKSPIIGSNQERNHEVNARHATARTKNETLKNPSNGAGDTVVITEQLTSKRNKDNNFAQFQNVKSPKKQTKENGAEHSKPKANALRDLYPDFDVQENVASYNYILDSGEFIRVDGNDQNKINKKQNNSNLIPDKNEKPAASGKITQISSEPSEPLKDQSKPEIFGTILEYLYKYSNSTLLLSLREYNSSESQGLLI